ncbi:hypothetical protein Pelo_4688 [Pelomyxa schiedti]|nr:hypothetical protein Pelo_4688 [Pelomyxa schiedti]
MADTGLVLVTTSSSGGEPQTLSERFTFVNQQKQAHREQRLFAARARRQNAVARARQLAYAPVYDNVTVANISHRRTRGGGTREIWTGTPQHSSVMSRTSLHPSGLMLSHNGRVASRPRRSRRHRQPVLTANNIGGMITTPNVPMPLAVPMFVAPQQVPFVIQQGGPPVQYIQHPLVSSTASVAPRHPRGRAGPPINSGTNATATATATANSNGKGKGRGGRKGRGRGKAKGKGNGNGKLTADSLNNDLEGYMSKNPVTKQEKLDNELEQYLNGQ